RVPKISALLVVLGIIALLNFQHAQAQFVAGGSADGSEDQTGQGAYAGGSAGNTAVGPNANSSGTSSNNTAVGNLANAQGDNGSNVAVGVGAVSFGSGVSSNVAVGAGT